MAFRADEAAVNGYERVRKYLIPVTFSPEVRAKSEEVLLKIIDELGPVVESYPSWHPLVSNHDERHPETIPSERTGYQGLDHTRYFAHGFISCPYGGVDGLIASISSINHHYAGISAEVLDVKFYADGVTPVLVRCDWPEGIPTHKMIPKRIAVPLMLEQELPCWKWARRPESWEVMRSYFLGEPHGSRSSLFVDQDTALAMKKVYSAMVDSGMFGTV